MTEIERVADALERGMFAPHELPLDGELHRKYLMLARTAIHAMREPVDEGMKDNSTTAALKAQDCPGGGWTGQPPSIERATVADCLAHGVCGCVYGGAVQEINRLRLVIAQEADRTEAADDEAMRRGHEIERLRDANR